MPYNIINAREKISGQNKKMKCNKCEKELDYKNKKENLWKVGDEGLKYKWNKIGEVKDYFIVCEDCKTKNHFLCL